MLKLQRKLMDLVEEGYGSFKFAERLEASGDPVSVCGNFRDRHLLEVSQATCTTLPESVGFGSIAVSGGGYSEPVEWFALTGKQVIGLPQRVRWVERSAKQAAGALRLVVRKSVSRKQNAGANELR